jgi:hypothetical protein
MIRLVGTLEILGATGIILPQALHILPFLTPVTAICFALIMIPAASIHTKRREFKSVALNAFLFLVSVFVAFERFKTV